MTKYIRSYHRPRSQQSQRVIKELASEAVAAGSTAFKATLARLLPKPRIRVKAVSRPMGGA